MPRQLAYKDFNDEYRKRQISDWRSGWYSLTSALNSAIMDAFDVGDMPMDDTTIALLGSEDSQGFIEALQEWVQQGIDLDFSGYMDDLQQSGSSMYNSMSNRTPYRSKAGVTYSAATRDMLGRHCKGLYDTGDQLHQMATQLAVTTGATTFDDSTGHRASGPSGDAAPPAKSARLRNTDFDEDEVNQAVKRLQLVRLEV